MLDASPARTPVIPSSLHELIQSLRQALQCDLNTQIVIEGYLGKGIIANSLENYRNDHIRICRPSGLSRQDAQKAIAHAINRLGSDYDVRQVLDLARFLIPWSILPRRWRSSLFKHHVGLPTKTVCSTMIAEAFTSIEFPILPVVKQHEETGIELFARNPRLFTPSDFDYSPYFEIIKYPFIPLSEGPYRHLPWNREGYISPDGENIVHPEKEKIKSESMKLERQKFVLRFVNKSTLPKDDNNAEMNGS